MRGLLAFIRLGRPHFLIGGFLMYGLGVAAAGSTTLGTYLLGQTMVTAAQVTAHFVNEFGDVDADRLVENRTWFSGGSGVLSEGSLQPRVALTAAWVSSVLAIVVATTVIPVSPAAAMLGFAALGVSWAYSIPPVRLLARGWGELATTAVVVVAVPLIGLFVASGTLGADFLAVLLVLFPVHLAMMLVFEVPDIDSDRRAGKRVLAVRFGQDTTLVLIELLYLLAIAAALLGPKLEGGDARPGYAVAVALVLIAIGLVVSLERSKFALATPLAVAGLVVVGAWGLFRFI